MRLVALIFATLVSSCGRDAVHEQIIRPVRTMVVQSSNTADQRIFAGVSKAGVESRISFRVAGAIVELPVKVGDQVHKGELIAKLDAHDYELQHQEAEAALQQAIAMERQTIAQYNRVSNLYETESASRAELDAARAQAESSKASRQAAQHRVDLAQNQLQYTVLTAPQEGDIAAVPVQINENVAAGQPIVVLNSGETAEVTVSLPETLIATVHTGDAVSVTFDAKPDQTFPAVVTEVGVARNTSPAYPVRVQLLHHATDIRSGMSAEVQFSFGNADDDRMILIPAFAVAEVAGEQYVYVVHATEGGLGTVEKRPVKVGGFNSDRLKVLNGLHDGDVVVTAGIQFLKNGEKVRLKDEK